MGLHTVNPLQDHRWSDFVSRHPNASVFHSSAWLQALALTYNYEPYVLTSATAGIPLEDGIPLCRVRAHVVSLPFADHCDPLAVDKQRAREVVAQVRIELHGSSLRYVEFRPLSDDAIDIHGLRASQSYWFHELDLTPTLERLFRRLHKNSFQRKIRRAERERLTHEVGTSAQFVEEFYRLLLLTRRRHLLIPQPQLWFENLRDCFGPKLQIRLVRKNGVAIAAALAIRHGATLVYKYGCSDAKFHRLGGVPFLLWKMIEESKANGISKIDFGRSDIDDLGLITFKDRLGTTKQLLAYYRFPGDGSRYLTARWPVSNSLNFLRRHAGSFFMEAPDALLSAAGRLLYKHFG